MARAPMLDSPTLVGGDTTPHVEDLIARRPVLTVLWHPDARRVGSRAVLSVRLSQVSRLEPLFEAPGARPHEGEPLADPYVSSRTASFHFAGAGAGILISPGYAGANVKVDGTPLRAPLTASALDLERGVLITLARRHVLCLHYARPGRTPPVEQHGIVGVSDAVLDIRRDIDRVADSTTPVLIRGETGTGKELVARALRAGGRRSGSPFVAMNMGKLQPDRAVADLFGYERGAFTGAASSHPGQFRSADGGTLFLDEIGLTPLAVQPMLLRVLEDGLVQPLGSSQPPRRVDVRIIAATDTDLDKAMAEGTFSPALFERLARYPISLPPLRARREDVGVLLVHFLRLHFAEHGEPDRLTLDADAPTPWLSASSVAALAAFNWPHNIRQLSNAAERIVIDNLRQEKAELPKKVRDEIAGAPSPSEDQPSAWPPAPTPSDKEVAEAFHRHEGNLKNAAAALGISRTTYYELRKRNPFLPQLSAILDTDLLAAHAASGGDVARTAKELRLPVKALKDRLARILKKQR